MGDWSRYTNQKLFLAERLWVQQARMEDLPTRKALEEGAIWLIYQAYQGLLNELAETRRLRERVSSLDELRQRSEYDTEWTQRLQALMQQSGSWLQTLLAEVRRLEQPPRNEPSETGTSSLASDAMSGTLIVASSGGSRPEGPEIIREIRAMAAELREFNQQF